MHLDLLTHLLKAPPLCAGGLPPPPMPGGVCPSAPCSHLKSKRHVATAHCSCTCEESPPPHPPLELWTWQAGRQKSATQVTTSLDGQNNEARSTSSAHQLWVPTFLVPPGSLEHHSIRVGCSCVRRTIAMQGTHQRRVSGQLGPTESGQPICDHFQSTTVCGFWERQIEIPDQNVGGHTGTCFAAHSSCSALECKTSPTQCPRSGARCTVVAKRIDWAATPAHAPRERQWEAEATEQKWSQRGVAESSSSTWSIFSCTPEPHIAFCPIFVHSPSSRV